MNYEELYIVLLRYAHKCWNGLFTPPEDLVQDTMLYIWQHEEKIRSKDYSYCCGILKNIAHKTLLKEHKDGMWANISPRDYRIYENRSDHVTYIYDEWLDDYTERRRASGRKHYAGHKEKYREYYQEHKEEIKAKRKQYVKENEDKVKAYQKEYRKKKKKYKAQKNYRKRQREKVEKIKQDYYEQTGIVITLKDATKILKTGTLN